VALPPDRGCVEDQPQRARTHPNTWGPPQLTTDHCLPAKASAAAGLLTTIAIFLSWLKLTYPDLRGLLFVSNS